MDRLDQGYRLDGSSRIGDEEGSELEYAENDEYVTPPEEGRLVPVEEALPPAELVIYAPDNEGDSDIEVFESVRDGEADCQVWRRSVQADLLLTIVILLDCQRSRGTTDSWKGHFKGRG